MTTSKEALKVEKECRRKLEKEYDVVMNDGIQSALIFYIGSSNKWRSFFSRIEIPLERMGMNKNSVDREIVIENEEAYMEVEEDEGPDDEAWCFL